MTQKPDLKLELAFASDFSVSKGPDLYVYLSKGNRVTANAVILEKLKANSGVQSYAIPAGVNLNDFQFVIAHCKQYNQRFAFAELK